MAVDTEIFRMFTNIKSEDLYVIIKKRGGVSPPLDNVTETYMRNYC